MDNNLLYTPVSTKVTFSDKEKLGKLAEKFNMSFYQLFQCVLLTLLRYFDNFSTATEEHSIFINAFNNVRKTVVNSFNPLLINPKYNFTVYSSIVFVNKNKRTKPQLVYLKNNDKNILESYNVDEMLKDFLYSADPEILNILEREKEYNKDFSLLNTMHSLIVQNSITDEEIMNKEIAEMFSDQRIESGEEIIDDVYYKNKLNYSGSNFEGQSNKTTKLAEF